jgi:hypothetical protein
MGVKVVPLKDGEEKTAKTLTGLIRSIERGSNAANAYNNAVTEQYTCGFGGWRIITEWMDESFDQEIFIKPILSARTALTYDPSAEEYDKSDALYAFVEIWMLKEAYRRKYPDYPVVDMPDDSYAAPSKDWIRSDSVRIVEYWYKVPYERTIALLSDGRVVDAEEDGAVLDDMDAQVVRTRKVESHKVYRAVMNGNSILEDSELWAGKYIPLIPLYGRVAWLEGRQYIRGLVRKAKDAQRIYNYARSSAVEAVAGTPRSTIWLTPEQAKGHVRELNSSPATNPPYMLYNPDPRPGVANPPQRMAAIPLQPALIQEIEQSTADIHATTGIEPASLGDVPKVKSGKAIEAETRQGDRGLSVFSDNLKQSYRYMGKVLVDLIPRIYDTRRVVKILGPDEVYEDVTLNDPQVNGINEPVVDEETGKVVLVNDLSQGSYGVTVTTGPRFATKKEETVSQLIALAKDSEVVQELGLDLIVSNMDINQGEELTERIRRWMIKAGTVEPTDEERKEMGLDRPQPPDPMQEALINNLRAQTETEQVKGRKLISEARNKDADTQQKTFETQETVVKAYSELISALAEKIDAGGALTPNDIRMLRGQSALVAESQMNVLERNELAGTPPLAAVSG